MLSVLSTRALSILIIAVLNSQSGNTNIPAMSPSVSSEHDFYMLYNCFLGIQRVGKRRGLDRPLVI